MNREPAPGPGVTPSGPVVVRAMAPHDIARVWEMLNALATYERMGDRVTGTADMLADALWGSEPGARDAGDRRLRGLVAHAPGGALVGYALVFPVFGSFSVRWRLWLEDLFVEPAARGQGTGLALLAAVARMARESGCSSVDWEVLDWNEPSIRFYERIGSRRIVADWYHYRIDGDALARLALGNEPPAL